MPETRPTDFADRTAILVPVKAFDRAKVRLAEALDAKARAGLARRLASGVLAAAHDAGLPVAVACADAEVAAWAQSEGAFVVDEPDEGLNTAVGTAVSGLASLGAKRVCVVHADLPRLDDLGWVANFPGVTLVPDRRGDGTNVISIPASSGFSFHYGPGSFTRHIGEVRRLGLPERTVRGTPLAWDIDVPSDLTYVP